MGIAPYRFHFLLVASLCIIFTDPSNCFHQKWAQFKQSFRKMYTNEKYDLRRMNVFQDNLKRIEEHNKLYESGRTTFKMGINQFADMTPQEFVSYNRMKTSNNPGFFRRLRAQILPYDNSNYTIPEYENWVEKNAVTPIKNQGPCGSCWSFSATGSLEGQYYLKTGKLVSLSEQNLVDCAGESYGNSGCGGGWMDNAFEYVIENGIHTEKDYPYTAEDGVCQQLENETIVFKAKTFSDIGQGKENDLKAAIHFVGPISIGVDASNWQFYHSGIFQGYECSDDYLNHGVLAVGYGTENGTDYWLIKNSWGTSWGDDGYMKLIRKDNYCGAATAASFPGL